MYFARRLFSVASFFGKYRNRLRWLTLMNLKRILTRKRRFTRKRYRGSICAEAV